MTVLSTFNRGTKYLEKGNYLKAIQFFKKQLKEADFKELWLNLGNAYRLNGNLALAVDCYSKANDPAMPYANGSYSTEYSLALNNLGLAVYSLGDDETAILLYKKALALSPLYYDALWNYGNAVLRRYFTTPSIEDWILGWQMYEYRFKKDAPVRVDSGVRWDGISDGESIVVLAEQGIGDKIMFGRYLPHLAKKFKKVYVQCHPSMDWFFKDYIVCRESTVAPVSIPMCSLAGIFGIVDERWITSEARKFDGFNIGVVWSGSPTHRNNHNRSCPSSYMSSLSSYGNLYSVTPGCNSAARVTHIGSTDWSETAATVMGLDVVVTVDTSIVHLCGSLGVPCIMVQPLADTDFRWGVGCSDTPWYSSVRIVQNNGWDSAFKEVEECIKKFKVDGVL